MIGGNVVPLFKTFEQLQSDEAEILADYEAELDAAVKADDLARAGLGIDKDELSKLNTVDRELAKAAADRLLGEARGDVAIAKANLRTEGLTAIRDALRKRNERLFGIGELAKRSRRFATAASRRYYGPAASVTSLEVKR
jgi:hypothetical protein